MHRSFYAFVCVQWHMNSTTVIIKINIHFVCAWLLACIQLYIFIYRLKLHYRLFHPNSQSNTLYRLIDDIVKTFRIRNVYFSFMGPNTQELCTLYISLECEIPIWDICMLNGFNTHISINHISYEFIMRVDNFCI